MPKIAKWSESPFASPGKRYSIVQNQFSVELVPRISFSKATDVDVDVDVNSGSGSSSVSVN